jgi:hypothetical protein
VAGLASSAGRGANLGATLLFVPLMYLVYIYYRMRVFRAVLLDDISTASQENETALAGMAPGPLN